MTAWFYATNVALDTRHRNSTSTYGYTQTLAATEILGYVDTLNVSSLKYSYLAEQPAPLAEELATRFRVSYCLRLAGLQPNEITIFLEHTSRCFARSSGSHPIGMRREVRSAVDMIGDAAEGLLLLAQSKK